MAHWRCTPSRASVMRQENTRPELAGSDEAAAGQPLPDLGGLSGGQMMLGEQAAAHAASEAAAVSEATATSEEGLSFEEADFEQNDSDDSREAEAGSKDTIWFRALLEACQQPTASPSKAAPRSVLSHPFIQTRYCLHTSSGNFSGVHSYIRMLFMHPGSGFVQANLASSQVADVLLCIRVSRLLALELLCSLNAN